MSETETAAKPAKPVAPAKPAESAKAAQSAENRRGSQPKKFAPSTLQPLGQDFELLAVAVPDDWTMEDLLLPVAWANVAALVAKDIGGQRRDKIGSLIYARSKSIKVILTIEGITLDKFGSANGLNVEPWIK